ncbi:cell death abnormality protein 1-like isoform X1 [Ruditapes philippinarum]|uniref:cell death abnormality protein 1-like isoform X1 n=1 Tax=Ruditapes philippinarum TaxID=129788 RepID=UPI00295C1CCB|nr:cell death abnormality protein 1-like isoform X1 [Ruditapes philippinarum]
MEYLTNRSSPTHYLGLIFIFLTCIPSPVYGVSLGDPCMTNSDCSDLGNSECTRIFDCVTGSCTCQTGYGNETGTGCNKILSGFNEPCGTGYYCNEANQICDTTIGRCACTTWYDYHTTAKACVFRTYKILKESCGGQYNLQCLQALLDSGGECDGTCDCRSGYVADTSESYTTCRAPRWGESCQWLPQCVVSFDTTTISDDTSNNVPTCRNNICSCPPSHDHRYVNGYHLCLNKVDDGFERYKIGESCTHFSECESFLCVKCPGASSGVCMQDIQDKDSGVSSVGLFSSIHFVIILLQIMAGYF